MLIVPFMFFGLFTLTAAVGPPTVAVWFFVLGVLSLPGSAALIRLAVEGVVAVVVALVGLAAWRQHSRDVEQARPVSRQPTRPEWMRNHPAGRRYTQSWQRDDDRGRP